MPYQLSWYIPRRIISYRLYGVLTLDEITQSALDYLEMLKCGKAEVYTLLDLTQLDRFPANLAELARTLQHRFGEIQGWVVVVQKANPMLQYSVAMAAQMVLKNAHLRIESDIPTAVEFLLKQNATQDANAFHSQSLIEQGTTA